MLLPIALICPKNKARADRTSIVFIQYCYSATNRTLLNTDIAIPPEYWHKKQCCITDKLPAVYGNYAELNQELTRQQRIAEDLVTHARKIGISNPGAFVKKTFFPALNLRTGP